MEADLAVVEWLHTFHAGSTCESLEELSDGVVLVNVLHEIVSDAFDPDLLDKNVDGNWALAASNIRKLLRMLDEYFRAALFKVADVEAIDVNEIAKNHGVDATLDLVELVVGVAVQCEHKAELIQNIFSLTAEAQAVLKDLVQRVLQRTRDLEVSLSEMDIDRDDAVAELDDSRMKATEEELIRKNEMLTHLQSERQSLLDEVKHLTNQNQQLKLQLQSLSNSQQVDSSAEKNQRVDVLESRNLSLQRELDDLRRELDISVSDRETLKAELGQANKRLESSREMQSRLELENAQQADELDVARDNKSKLLKAEQTVEKYQKRVEELTLVKKQHKELSDQLDEYLEKVHTLEGANKQLQHAQKLGDNYKQRVQELERERVDILAERDVAREGEKLRSKDVERERERVRSLNDELNALRIVAEANASSAHGSSGGILDELDGSHGGESAAVLRAKVRSLEKALANAQTTAAVTVVPSSTADDDRIVMLQKELNDSKRESQLLKKEVHELREAGQSAENDNMAKVSRELNQKIHIIGLLEAQLLEKQQAYEKLQANHTKLGSIMTTYKDKINEHMVQTAAKFTAERADLEQKNTVLKTKLSRGLETWKKEEKLLSSAIYEVGLKMMEGSIQRTLQADASTTRGLLETQRLALSMSVDALTQRTPVK